MEVCVDCIESALNAAEGGASRIELCSALSEGGLTPTTGFLRQVKALVKIPVFAMIRPRRGDFCYSAEEVSIMSEDIIELKNNGADGFVIGVLKPNGDIDRSVCQKLLVLASPLPCTFHRAFDVACDPEKSLEVLINLGFQRLLTSGQCKTAEDGAPLIKKLVDLAKDRIIVMPGAGLTIRNVKDILKITGAKEFHASARKPIASKMEYANDSCNMGDACDEYELMVTDRVTVENMIAETKLG